MRARTFMQVSIGILALAAAYHLGARSAGAQGVGNAVVSLASGVGGTPSAAAAAIATSNGDIYVSADWVTWQHLSNVFSGPTPVQSTSFGALKARYR